jgi:hypothetical protein
LNLIRIMPAKGRELILPPRHDPKRCVIALCALRAIGRTTMETSIFLARLLGPSMLVIGIGLLVNRPSFRAMSPEFLDSPALIYLAGVNAFVAGLAMVLTHNGWVLGWPVIITLFGWLALFAGIFRIVFPSGVKQLGERLIESEGFLIGGMIFYLAIGASLSLACYFGAAA